ncbi:protein mono-ADP-ribosyltransferase PARP9 [Sarcophilus harrisii]|uniref:protein mono-ADP-ribosyltransferase PARP9 n=1 Tax=Sarcophilus harrisii TaxID=9305 RepID=UPI001301EB04|nr:protein mono-ADP-ribosyltransferase PARP9 [Sarcophilus harrisii]
MEQKSLQIAIDSDHLKTLKSYESLFNDVINKKFQCASNLKSAMDSAKVFRTMLSSQIELSVWKDDLTSHGGLAVEGKDKIKGGPIGKIVVTGGGQFSHSQIIQVVKEERKVLDKQTGSIQLKAEILNILEYVVSGSSGIKTVAIPALSSGIFGFPLNLCVGIIVDTIMNFSGYQRSKILKEIHLVSNEEPTVAAFKRSCEEFLGKNISAAPSLASITLNNVKLQIIEGFIEKQQVDVIVNCVPDQYSFPAGRISKTILDQVGTELEKDFFKKLCERSNIQELVVTTGFNLSCQYVYHLVWPSYYDLLLPEWHKKILKHAVMKCLEKAYQQNMNSLSFPALGIGTISTPKEETIHIMLQEVLRFSRDYPSKKLHVNFVIFPNDKELSKARYIIDSLG